MKSVEIIFKNKTTSITKAIVLIDGKKFIFVGDEAKQLANMANNDYPTIKNFIENLALR